MAGARLEKVGTIFARASGLLKRDVFKSEDKPIWYEIYALHPPFEEPRYDRPAPEIEVREIFYPEDNIRAKFHKQNKVHDVYKLSDEINQTKTQKFIQLYTKYRSQGALDDEKIFEVALQQLKIEDKSKPEVLEDEIEEKVEFGLASRFAQAIAEKNEDKPANGNVPKKKENSIDISSLFK